MLFIETSALDGTNIKTAFNQVALEYLKNSK